MCWRRRPARARGRGAGPQRTAARPWPRRGAQPLTGDLDDPAGLPDVFSARAVHVAGQYGVARLRARAGHRGRGPGRGSRPGRVRLHHRGDHRAARPVEAVRLAAERQIRESGLKWTILRPTMIYGAPGDRNLSRLLGAAAPGCRCCRCRAAGGQLQQPVHVADVAGAVLAAVERPAAAGSAYDIAGPEPLTFAELLRVAAQRGRQPDPVRPRAAGSRGRRGPLATSGSAAGRRSARSSCSGWPRTRRSPSTTRSGTWGTRPGRSPRASAPRPGPWDWPRRSPRD